MSEPRAIAIPVQQAPRRAQARHFFDVLKTAAIHAGAWAGDTAQQFGILLAVLMGPAVFSAYAITLWALASNLGWTDSFLFVSGPLSNWIVWLGMAALIHTAASILKRHTNADANA